MVTGCLFLKVIPLYLVPHITPTLSADIRWTSPSVSCSPTVIFYFHMLEAVGSVELRLKSLKHWAKISISILKTILCGSLLKWQKVTKTLLHTHPNSHLSLPEARSFFLQVLFSPQVLLPQRDRCDFLTVTGKRQGTNVPAVLPLGRTNLMSNLQSHSGVLRSMVPTAYTHTVAVFLLWFTFSGGDFTQVVHTVKSEKSTIFLLKCKQCKTTHLWLVHNSILTPTY